MQPLLSHRTPVSILTYLPVEYILSYVTPVINLYLPTQSVLSHRIPVILTYLSRESILSHTTPVNIHLPMQFILSHVTPVNIQTHFIRIHVKIHPPTTPTSMSFRFFNKFLYAFLSCILYVPPSVGYIDCTIPARQFLHMKLNETTPT